MAILVSLLCVDSPGDLRLSARRSSRRAVWKVGRPRPEGRGSGAKQLRLHSSSSGSIPRRGVEPRVELDQRLGDHGGDGDPARTIAVGGITHPRSQSVLYARAPHEERNLVLASAPARARRRRRTYVCGRAGRRAARSGALLLLREVEKNSLTMRKAVLDEVATPSC